MADEFKFIPTLWAGAILKALQKKTVFESLCNKDYIGEVRSGNKLKISTVNNPSVKDYESGENISYEDVDGTEQELKIDRQKYFAFKADDVESVQSAIPLLESATEGAGFALADNLDMYIADIVKTDGTLKKIITSNSTLDIIAQIVEAMDNAKSPDLGRWLVIPPSFAKDVMLELAGKLTDNAEILTSGYIGSIFGLNIFKSVNVSNLLCGNIAAVTFANQIEKTEAIRLQNTFASGIRGLHVYGAKVTRPELCGEITVVQSAAGD